MEAKLRIENVAIPIARTIECRAGRPAYSARLRREQWGRGHGQRDPGAHQEAAGGEVLSASERGGPRSGRGGKAQRRRRIRKKWLRISRRSSGPRRRGPEQKCRGARKRHTADNRNRAVAPRGGRRVAFRCFQGAVVRCERRSLGPKRPSAMHVPSAVFILSGSFDRNRLAFARKLLEAALEPDAFFCPRRRSRISRSVEAGRPRSLVRTSREQFGGPAAKYDLAKKRAAL